jgi:hypothetical protein
MTAVSEKPAEKPIEKPKDIALSIVVKKFDQRTGAKLKINPLFHIGGILYFRVNYIYYEGDKIQSYWVSVSDSGEIKIEEN